MAVSSNFFFENINVDKIISNAFAMCGINESLISGWQYKIGREDLNFVFTSWISKRGLNLFTVEKNICQIIPGQGSYVLPADTSKILECVYATANRLLITGSTPFSSAGGTASNAFDGNLTTACVQTSADGFISYTFPLTQPQPIQYVGITSAVTRDYTLSIDCSFLPNPSSIDWMTILQTPLTTYYYPETRWFALPFTKTALNWRIKETSGAILDITELYFDIPTRTQIMNSVGRDDYTGYQINAGNQSAANTYYLSRANPPTLNVYPLPNDQWQFFVYNRVRSIQDAGSYTDSLDVTPRFLDALTLGLAAKVSNKYNPQLTDQLNNLSENAFAQVAREDRENVDQRITMTQGAYTV